MRFIAPLLLLILAVSCAKPKDLQYVDFRNLRIVKAGFPKSTLALDIEFYNPNRYGLQLRKAEVDVYINKTYLGKSNLDSLISIPKKDSFLIPVTMQVETMGAITNVMRIVSDSAVLIKMDGKANFGRNGIFVNYPIKYEGLQRIKF